MLEIGNWILLLIYLNFIQKINANPIKFNLVTHFILKFIFERFLLEFFWPHTYYANKSSFAPFHSQFDKLETKNSALKNIWWQEFFSLKVENYNQNFFHHNNSIFLNKFLMLCVHFYFNNYIFENSTSGLKNKSIKFILFKSFMYLKLFLKYSLVLLTEM